MGKTRLANELAKRAMRQGMTVVLGGCSVAELALPYLPLLDWGDSGVGHPLLDMTAFMERVPAEWHDDISALWARAWSARSRTPTSPARPSW